METLSVHNTRGWAVRNCVKISQTFQDPSNTMGFLTGLLNVNITGVVWWETVLGYFEIQTANVTANLYVTSDANAYGPVTGMWFDGSVEAVAMEADHYYNFSVNGVTEYQYLPPNDRPCSQESFYKVLFLSTFYKFIGGVVEWKVWSIM